MSAFVLFSAVFVLSAPVPADDDPVKTERAHWQGSWQVTALEITTGKRAARLKFSETDGACWRIAGDELEIVGLMLPFAKARLSADATKQPIRITLTLADGPKKGQTLEGTYVRDGQRIDVDFPDWPKEANESAKVRLSLRKMGD